MGSSQRLAAVAAASHARHYNNSHTDVSQTQTPHYNVNILFVSATLCGVLVAVCAACWRRSPAGHKPEAVSEDSGVYTVSADCRLSQVPSVYTVSTTGSASATLCGVLVAVCAACWRRSPAGHKPEAVSEDSGVYTVSADCRLSQVAEPPPGPPPAYDTVVDCPVEPKDCPLQEVTTDPCSRCAPRCDSGLPSYEAAVMLKDTKL